MIEEDVKLAHDGHQSAMFTCSKHQEAHTWTHHIKSGFPEYERANLIQSILHNITFVCYKNVQLNFILPDTKVILLE